MDGQDIMGKHLDFWYFEIAHFVAKLIPQRVWDNKTEKLNLYERLMLAAPAIVLQKQMMKEFLAELSLKVGHEILSIYTATGKRIRTVISIPMYSKVLICSTEKSLKGLKNLDKVQAIADAMPERESIMKGHEADEEKVQQYLQTACISWMNKTENLETFEDQKGTQSPRAQDRAT